MYTQQPHSNPDLPPGASLAFSGLFPVLPAPGLVFWRWDETALSLCCAPEWSQSFDTAGETPPDDTTRVWWQQLFDEDKALLDNACADCLAGRGASVDLAVRARCSDRDWGWILVRGSLVMNDKGQRELVGYAADVSRLRTDKRFLPPARNLSGRARSTPGLSLASAPRSGHGFFPLHTDAPSAQRPPAPANEPGKTTGWDLGINDDLLAFHQRNIATVFETGTVVKESARLHTSLQGETIGEYCYCPEFTPDGHVCAVICQMRDLTVQACAEQENLLNERRSAALNHYIYALEKAKQVAEAASRAKDEFLANVSHELRTPLNGLLTMLQLLQLSPLSEEQEEYVRTANLSGQTLLRILTDILDFSRMKSGKMELRDNIFDLRETLLSTMNPFISQARANGLEASVSIDGNLPAALVGDDARVRQIISNLVGNALKFTQQGSIALECSLLPHTARNKAWIYIAVRDTGVGMPPQAHAVVFDAFTQLDSSSTREHSGTGLGLGIVKCLVRMMGGTLALESEPGEGTTIHCSLPFVRADRRVAERRMTDRRRRKPSAAGRNKRPLDILVAEDDPVGRFALRSFLLRAGHRAVCVETGRQALEALQLHDFDCLITDIQMPVMDGLETVRRIRQGHFAGITPSREVTEMIARAIPGADAAPRSGVPPDMPVIALTAHVMNGDREYFLHMGMDMYLSKPVVMEDLYAILDQARESASRGRRAGTA